MIIRFLAKYLAYLLLAILVFNMVQRRYQRHAQGKRMATLYLAILVLALMVSAITVAYFRLPDALFWAAAAALTLIGYFGRRQIFPFRLRCGKCGRGLSWRRILFDDANTCETCNPYVEGLP